MDVTTAEGGEGSEAAPASKKKKGRKQGKQLNFRALQAKKAELDPSAK